MFLRVKARIGKIDDYNQIFKAYCKDDNDKNNWAYCLELMLKAFMNKNEIYNPNLRDITLCKKGWGPRLHMADRIPIKQWDSRFESDWVWWFFSGKTDWNQVSVFKWNVKPCPNVTHIRWCLLVKEPFPNRKCSTTFQDEGILSGLRCIALGTCDTSF